MDVSQHMVESIAISITVINLSPVIHKHDIVTVVHLYLKAGFVPRLSCWSVSLSLCRRVCMVWFKLITHIHIREPSRIIPKIFSVVRHISSEQLCHKISGVFRSIITTRFLSTVNN